MKNTVVLIDTNVLLNYLTKRPDPFQEQSAEIVKMCAKGDCTGYMAFHSLSTLWYVLRKWNDRDRRQCLLSLCEVISAASASQDAVIEAIENDSFADFEDCLQDQCAKAVGADYIITCNIRDYDFSDVPAVTPELFLKLLRQ